MRLLPALSLCIMLAAAAPAAVAQEAAPVAPGPGGAAVDPPQDAAEAAGTGSAEEAGEPSGQVVLSLPEAVAALRALDDPEVAGRLAAMLEIPGELRPVFATHVRRIVASDAAVQEFAAAIAAADSFGARSAEERADIARALGIALAHETATLGVARLPLEDQRRFLGVELAALGHMGDELCAATTRGALDQVELLRAQLGYLATLETEAAEAYLALVRQALLAELADDPPFVPLSEAETRRAGAAYQAAAMAAIEAHPLRPLALEAVTDFETAPDAAVCLLTRLSLEAALGIEGPAGDLVVRLLTAG
jgi:hypothetical protein